MRAAVGDIAFTAVGVGACIAGWRLGVGSIDAPESGLMPFIVGAVLAFLGLLGLVPRRSSTVQALESETMSRMANNPRDWLMTVCAMIGLLVGVKYIGFVPTTFAFVLLLHWFTGPRRAAVSVVYASLVALVVWLVFSVWFGVSFG